ncbi:MAG: peptide chain release factor N(5)-glutamine methyltransferase [Eubacteriales bacterium]|nr:peptide chain release factor N(5)-glutamine methyltransferase [Eubacteriales bacterium]HBR32838.1 peptide chain release factor N(5)-glutamine methyltransferase [Clostridiales bacterium]
MRISEYRQRVKEAISSFTSDDTGAVTDILFSEVLGIERGTLLAVLDREIDEKSAEIIAQAVNQLSLGFPLQYVLGSCYFYGRKITVGSGCFIPRSDTEILVQAATGVIRDKSIVFADICAGSGCISLALALEKPNSRGYSLELSRKAIRYAEINLVGVKNVIVKRFDALDEEDYISLAGQNGDRLDLIVSNPPYIPTEQISLLDPQVQYEPETALDGGEDGLKFYREIIKNAPVLLKDDGAILFEVGINQAEPVSGMLELNGYSVAVFKDYGRIDRVVLGKRC